MPNFVELRRAYVDNLATNTDKASKARKDFGSNYRTGNFINDLTPGGRLQAENQLKDQANETIDALFESTLDLSVRINEESLGAAESKLSDLVDQAKELQIKSYINQLKKEAGETPSTTQQTMGTDLAKSLISDPASQKQWLTFTPEQRQIIMASIQSLSLSQGGKTNGLNMWMPFMMMQMKNKPETNLKEMMELVNIIRPAQPTNDAAYRPKS